jgi:hypothetical protein
MPRRSPSALLRNSTVGSPSSAQHLGGQQPGTAFRAPPSPRRKRTQRSTSPTEDTTGHAPESMASLKRCDGGWRVGVEVVEVARIPDSADILAVNDVRLDDHGDLISYQRTRR